MSMADRKDAYDALNYAIDELVRGVAPEGHIATDAVLVVGCQAIADDGHRIGSVGIFLKDGCQPMWISRALLAEAMDTMAGDCQCDKCTDATGG